MKLTRYRTNCFYMEYTFPEIVKQGKTTEVY